MMNKKFMMSSVATAMVLSAPIALAEDSPHEFSANVAMSTDYVFRGVSQTNSGPAISGGFDYAYSGLPVGLYAGTWAANVDFATAGPPASPDGDDALMEIDFYAGLTGDLFNTGIGWDVGGLYYFYPSQDEDSNFNYWEAYGSLSYTFAGLPFEPTITGFLAYSPEYFGDDDNSIYVTGDLSLSLPYGIGLAFLVGNLDVDGDQTTGTVAGGTGIDYTHWSVGLSKDISIFTLDLTYHNAGGENDALPMDGCGIIGDCDDRIVFTVSSSF